MHTATFRYCFPVLAMLAALALLVSACGGEEESGEPSAGAATTEETTTAAPSGGGDGTVTLTADSSGGLSYLESEVTAAAGEVEINFDNPSDVIHDVVIEQDGKTIAETERVTAGETSTTVELAPGTYTYYCSLTGHRAAGMEGTLRVE